MGCPDNSSGMLNKVFIGGLVNTSHIALTILVFASNIAIVVVKEIPWRCAYPQEIFIKFLIIFKNYALFELRNLTKMKDTTETVC